MHDVRVVDPLGHLLQYAVMPDIVEEGAQVHVEDSGLVLHDRFRDSLHCLLRRPLGSIAIRPGLEVGLKDGLQDELERSLDHAVSDRGNREDADTLAPLLGNLRVPMPRGLIRWCKDFLNNLSQDLLTRTYHPAR